VEPAWKTAAANIAAKVSPQVSIFKKKKVFYSVCFT
jgi:hypothetical protein